MNIRLGLDIGTQYSYASYSYREIIQNADGSQENSTIVNELQFWKGIPTEVCYDEQGNVHCGENVYSVYENGCYKLKNRHCLKELMRTFEQTHAEQLHWYDKDGKRDDDRYIEKSLGEMMESFLQYFKNCIVNKLNAIVNKPKAAFRDYRIIGVTIAFPNRTGAADFQYQEGLRCLVSKVFFGNADGNNVNVYSESTCTADLLKRLYAGSGIGNNKYPKNICSIDVGAGTTDFSCMIWNRDRNKYDDIYTWTSNFGGKYIDRSLSNVCDIRNCYDMERYKRWLYDDANKKWAGQNCEDTSPEQCSAGQNCEDTSPEQRSRFICPLYNSDRDKLKIGNKKIEEYIGTVNNSINDSYRELNTGIERMLSYINDPTAKIKFVLSGGSSVLPAIRNAIESKMRSLKNNKYTIEYLGCLAQGTMFSFLNNSNFLSVAAALINASDETIRTCSSSRTYAFRYYDNKKRGFLIINNANEVKCNEDGKLYYMFKEKAVQDGEVIKFSFDGVLYAIYDNTSYKIMQFVPDETVNDINIRKIEFRGFPKKQMLEKQAYIIGVIVDCAKDVNNTISVYIYDPNTYECYCGNETPIAFDVFLESVDQTAEQLGSGAKDYKNRLKKIKNELEEAKKSLKK